jgi:hypothetical protein
MVCVTVRKLGANYGFVRMRRLSHTWLVLGASCTSVWGWRSDRDMVANSPTYAA